MKQRERNGQSSGSVMRMYKFWKKLEEALPRIKECGMVKVSKLYKAKTGVGRDGFHPKVSLDVKK